MLRKLEAPIPHPSVSGLVKLSNDWLTHYELHAMLFDSWKQLLWEKANTGHSNMDWRIRQMGCWVGRWILLQSNGITVIDCITKSIFDRMWPNLVWHNFDISFDVVVGYFHATAPVGTRLWAGLLLLNALTKSAPLHWQVILKFLCTGTRHQKWVWTKLGCTGCTYPTDLKDIDVTQLLLMKEISFNKDFETMQQTIFLLWL